MVIWVDVPVPVQGSVFQPLRVLASEDKLLSVRPNFLRRTTDKMLAKKMMSRAVSPGFDDRGEGRKDKTQM